MAQKSNSRTKQLILGKIIEKRIFLIRGHKVMFDSDLAELYGVETRVLNQGVQRNIGRFPEDFMFQLIEAEWESLRSQFVISKGRGGRRSLPYAYTESGVAMLSSILNSEAAIQINVIIIRTFVKLRSFLIGQADVLARLDALEKSDSSQNSKISEIFRAIRELITPAANPSKKPIGIRFEK